MTRFRMTLRTVVVAILLADIAVAGCTSTDETLVLRKSLRQAARCRLQQLRSAPGSSCAVSAAPECAGSLVTDITNLSFGRAPLDEVDQIAMSDQFRCQRRIG